MGRSPCCSDQEGIKKGPWSQEEDKLLVEYVNENGPGNWQTLPKKAGLNRCGKSCRLRWTNYLRPDIKRGPFSKEEEAIIISLHQESGNKWSKIAAYLPGRTDNEIKNYWNTHLRKKLLRSGVDPKTHKQISDLDCLYQFLSNSNLSNLSTPLSFQGNPSFQFLQNLQQVINLSSLPYLQAASQLNLNGLQINGVNTEFTAGNFFQPQAILPELSNFTPLLNELYATSNSFLLGGHGISTFSATNLDSAHVSPAESDSFSEEVLAHDTSNMAPQAGILSPSNSLQGYIPTQAFESDIFDNLDNFLDDEASSSFLKDILG